jgi:hypothetical protein
MSHINILDIDLTKVQLVKVGRNPKLLYNKEPLQLITTKLFSPFGVKVSNSDYSPFTNCVLDCSLNNSNSDNAIKVKDAFEGLDARILQLLEENVHLFKDSDNVNFDDVNIYSSIFRENKTYPKLIKITLPRDKNGNFKSVVFNEKKEKVMITDSNIEEVLHKRKVFLGIIECTKIWFFKGRFGSQWELTQMRYSSSTNTNNNNSGGNVSGDINGNGPSNIYNNCLLIDD